MAATTSPNLSKSRFVAGSQCDKLLWLKVHEQEAPELAINPRLRDLFTQGNEVGALARARFPGGVMVDHDDPMKLERTRALIAARTPVIFEAAFVADRTYAAVDVLLLEPDGSYTLIEVKSSTSEDIKEKYVLDAAVQAHVARGAGVDVRRVEIMHLNRDYTHPGPADLFVRTEVTQLVNALNDIPDRITHQLAMLAGPQPTPKIGEHCRKPNECAFMGRCWPSAHDSVLMIQGMRYDKRFELHHAGVPSIGALPANFKLNDVQRRQRRAIEAGSLIVEPTLAGALEPFQNCALGFLDFETVYRAVPRWEGTRPWQQIGVQWSFHERTASGSYLHRECIAEPDCDPRHDVARALVEATSGVDKVAMYTPFERTQIRMMQEMNPSLAGELAALEAKLLDLNTVVKNCVYHPQFGGSFSLKEVLPALVGTSYKDTVTILDGQEASVKLARLLFYNGELNDIERASLKRELLAYCKQDTWAMVQVLDKLQSLV